MTAWNSFSTDSPLGITSEVITYTAAGGDQIHAYVSRPTGGASVGAASSPCITCPAGTSSTASSADRLARHGYTEICLDLYCRFGHGSPDDVAATVRAAGRRARRTAWWPTAPPHWDWLLAQLASNGETVILGTSSGGRHALLTACMTSGWETAGRPWGDCVIMPPEELTPQRPVAVIDYTEGPRRRRGSACSATTTGTRRRSRLTSMRPSSGG